MAEKPHTLQFVPFVSCMDVGFLYKLTQNKLDVYGLNEDGVPVAGFYSNGDASGLPSRLSVDFTAFDKNPQIPRNSHLMLGTLCNKNTMENFKNCDKKAIINELATMIWNDIISGDAVMNPQLLSRFLLLMILKKYRYYYWFAFPALCYPTEFFQKTPPMRLDQSTLKDKMVDIYKAFDSYENIGGKSYFILHVNESEVSIHPLKSFCDLFSKQGQIYLSFCDPSNFDLNPGWPLRNLLSLAAFHWLDLTDEFQVLCLRDRTWEGVRSIGHSLLLDIKVVGSEKSTEPPQCVGWEKNNRQKFGPQVMNLSSTMDPVKLAESSVDLNLKLMKWRLMPTLDLERISETRCLLLGSGTLGCNVARMLLAWGIKTITLVDNGRVSYSNPVRQTLFNFSDCTNGGKPKAEAAAEALKQIFPSVKSSGINLSIPMPGHPINDSVAEQVKKDVAKLEALFDEHDVVFLLMDTRESRWLPTVIAAAKGKLVINAALGFDTYLVLRHGLKVLDQCGDGTAKVEDSLTKDFIPGSMLGCYFCNDVVAPGNSTRDRTLDQQCTVTRPGVSMLASSLAVELLVSILQQPLGGYVPAATSIRDDHLLTDSTSGLGIIPHQIRGFLSRYYHVLPTCVAFDQCTACSPLVIQAYKSDGFDFLLKVFNQPTYLEDLTGLTDLHNETETAEVWELSDDES